MEADDKTAVRSEDVGSVTCESISVPLQTSSNLSGEKFGVRGRKTGAWAFNEREPSVSEALAFGIEIWLSSFLTERRWCEKTLSKARLKLSSSTKQNCLKFLQVGLMVRKKSFEMLLTRFLRRSNIKLRSKASPSSVSKLFSRSSPHSSNSSGGIAEIATSSGIGFEELAENSLEKRRKCYFQHLTLHSFSFSIEETLAKYFIQTDKI